MEIREYVLKNEKLEAHFINIGACITKLIDLETGINVIVGHQDLHVYAEENPGYMNACIGRNAGRIKDFLLGGKIIRPTKNINNFYQLHGGFNGFNKKDFAVETEGNWIRFSATSIDGEEGYPGNVKFSLTYTLINDELHLEYEAISDKKTLMSYTNHAYFNLNGDAGTIMDHELYLNADRYFMLDRHMLPYKAVTVDQTPLDFRKAKIISRDADVDFEQLELAGGFDHPFLIRKTEDFNHVARVKSHHTNLVLDVFSTEDAVVFYAGNMISSSCVLNNSVVGHKHAGLCLETQGVPNSPNIAEFKERNIYEPGQKYYQKTVWKLHR
ncbi:MAG: galactose mutarotase [Acholeplasmataceae bacterium]|nr:galactose mutarotase [Acholeplasmataceae bacterium]